MRTCSGLTSWLTRAPRDRVGLSGLRLAGSGSPGSPRSPTSAPLRNYYVIPGAEIRLESETYSHPAIREAFRIPPSLWIAQCGLGDVVSNSLASRLPKPSGLRLRCTGSQRMEARPSPLLSSRPMTSCCWASVPGERVRPRGVEVVGYSRRGRGLADYARSPSARVPRLRSTRRLFWHYPPTEMNESLANDRLVAPMTTTGCAN